MSKKKISFKCKEFKTVCYKAKKKAEVSGENLDEFFYGTPSKCGRF